MSFTRSFEENYIKTMLVVLRIFESYENVRQRLSECEIYVQSWQIAVVGFWKARDVGVDQLVRNVAPQAFDVDSLNFSSSIADRKRNHQKQVNWTKHCLTLPKRYKALQFSFNFKMAAPIYQNCFCRFSISFWTFILIVEILPNKHQK